MIENDYLTKSWWEYPQTWTWNVKLRRYLGRRFLGKGIYNFNQWLCGKCTGHELSKTEKGFGGGIYMDSWCRWCNHLMQIPIQESPSDQWMRDIYNNGQVED